MNAQLSSPHGRSARKRGVLAVLGSLAAMALVLIPLVPAQARLEGPQPVLDAQTGPNTEIVITSLGAGLTLTGYQPPTAIVPDPATAYPATPPAGYVPETTFAGVINTASVDDPSLTAQMYCINLRVSTNVGVGYESGTWEESNVPNIGYVTYILNNYFPTTAAPTGLGANEQAAAVQAAIWFFTDGLVLGADPAAVRAATAAIVADAQTNGPVTEPPAPDVTISPATDTAAEGTAAGPFVVTAQNAAAVTVTVPAGYAMYSDAALTTPIANESEVASGTSIWVTGPGVTGLETVLSARAYVIVQRGNVYLYDGNTPSLSDAQRLILANTATLEAIDEATVEFFAAGELTVNKTFSGGAVGQQGAIQLAIDCGEGFTFTADIPAGATAAQTFTYGGIPVGNTCTVTEPTTGATTEVDVTTNAPQEVEMAAGGAAVTVTNAVEFVPGSLNLVKVIAGSGAGSQDEISVSVTCVSGLNETFVIPAGSAAGEYTQTYAGLPAGDECTVAEGASGANTVVTVTTDAPVTVTITPATAVEARVTNTVEFVPGSLNLTKVIAGAAAGSQSEVTVSVVCDTGLDETFVIPAGSAAGEYTQSYADIPAGSSCTVTELASGANSVVEVAAADPVTVTIEPATAAAAELANTVSFRPGALNVVKVIRGTGAGLQSAITVGVTCDNGLDETFDIPARAVAGEYVHTFSDLPAGTVCTVTELSSGVNSSVQVVADTSVVATIQPGAQVDATLTNTVLRVQTAGSGLALSGGDAPAPLLAAGAGLLGLGVVLLMAMRTRGKAGSRE